MDLLDGLVPKLGSMNPGELTQMLKSLQNILNKTKELLDKETTDLDPIDSSLFTYDPNPSLDNNLYEEVYQYLKTLKYHRSSNKPHSPEIHVFGERKYGYNRLSADIDPTSILPKSVVDRLLRAMNKLMGTNYNHMLVNKYRDVNCALGPHKDDEKTLNPASPISSMSFGKTRELQISLDAAKHSPVKCLLLTAKSIFTMLPGFQDKYWHAIAAGDKNVVADSIYRGVRYSVTFREMLQPQLPTPPPLPLTPGPASQPAPAEQSNTNVLSSTQHPPTVDSLSAEPDTLVFGSSLLKGLDDKLLSKYERKFKVYCHSGAHVKDIYEDIERVENENKVDFNKVNNVFLLCGGNDLENIKSDNELTHVFEDIEDLLGLARDVFPCAKINIFSLIPRRSKYKNHIVNMHKVNHWLEVSCKKWKNIRMVNIFTHFLIKKHDIWELSSKLFNSSNLHFNKVGDSVLAKVLLGVANLPR